jgi:hypothetical protein
VRVVLDWESIVMSDFKLLLDGMLVEGAGTLDVINPAIVELE